MGCISGSNMHWLSTPSLSTREALGTQEKHSKLQHPKTLNPKNHSKLQELEANGVLGTLAMLHYFGVADAQGEFRLPGGQQAAVEGLASFL